MGDREKRALELALEHVTVAESVSQRRARPGPHRQGDHGPRHAELPGPATKNLPRRMTRPPVDAHEPEGADQGDWARGRVTRIISTPRATGDPVLSRNRLCEAAGSNICELRLAGRNAKEER